MNFFYTQKPSGPGAFLKNLLRPLSPAHAMEAKIQKSMIKPTNGYLTPMHNAANAVNKTSLIKKRSSQSSPSCMS